jgi:hypothetical protein
VEPGRRDVAETRPAAHTPGEQRGHGA